MEMMGYSYMAKVKKETKMTMNPNMKNGVANKSTGDLLISQLSDMRTLRLMSRSLIVVLLLVVLPSIGSVMSNPSHANDESNLVALVEKGILKKGLKGLVVATSGVAEGNLAEKDYNILYQNGIYYRYMPESYVMNGDTVNLPNEALDFVFVKNLKNVIAIDRLLKLGGIVISQLETNKQFQAQNPTNYVVVNYMWPLEHRMVVLRKISPSSSMDGSEKKMPQGRSLCGITPEAKKAALHGLEDAMLEPPREKMVKGNKLSRKMKFLPDILKDSLKNYPRRFFFSDGDKGVKEWFKKNYPSKGQEFEMYDMEVVANEANNGKSSGAGLLSDWLRNHVKAEDYVVMKAEVALVEEMIKENTTCLVDELFLDCKNQWGDEEEDKEKASNKRSYWQCLSLYGRLRDEGVAVHQWWS